MAARKFSPKHDEQTRSKIQTSQLINRLMGHANGEVEMSATQVRAAEILLKKTIPDLSSMELGSDPDKPVKHVFGWAS